MGDAAEASRSGDLLNDTYELTELITSGELHQSYRARDTVNDRVVRVALLRPELALRAGVAQRFTQTPKTLSQIDHPNLLRVISVETDMSGIPFVVEEDLSGGQTLASMLESFPEGMPLGVAMNLLAPVVEAVAAVHARGLGHGAIDAEHILLMKVAGSTVPKLTGLGAEQEMRGDLRGDVRAIGALLYRALSGQAPAAGKRYTPLDELAPHLPHELTDLVERCLGPVDVRPSHAVLVTDQLGEIRQRLGGVRTSTVGSPKAKAPNVEKPAGAAAAPSVQQAPGTSTVREVEKKPASATPRRVAIERAATEPLVNAFAATAYDEGADTTDDDEPSIEVGPAQPSTPENAATVVDEDVLAMSKTAFAVDAPSAMSEAATERPPAPSSASAASKASPVAFVHEPDDGFPLANPNSVPAPAPAPTPARAAAPERVRADAKTDETRGPSREKKKKKGERDKKKDEPLSGLAAAFGPLAGAAEIGQQESAAGELAREFRKSMEDKSARRRGGVLVPDTASEPSVTEKAALAAAKKASEKKGGPAANPAVTLLAQHYAEEEKRKKRFAGWFRALPLLLFAFGLQRAVPLMTNTPRAELVTLLGPKLTIVTVAFTALSVVALVQTWAMQIRTPGIMSKTLTWTLKVVTACVCIVGFSLLLPESALGPVEGWGRRALPWGSTAFFLAFAGYGLVSGMELAQANLIFGLLLAMIYSGGFYGSYSVAKKVLIPGMKKKSQQEIAAEVSAELGVDPALAESGDPNRVGIDAPTAAESGMTERKMAGGNEDDDLRAIESMGNARKHNSEKLNELNSKIDVLRTKN